MSLRPGVQNLALLLATLLILVGALEVGFRLVNPFPYYSLAETSTTRHSKVTERDSLLGWKGIPDCSEPFTTVNGQSLIEHNRLGFRDVEHIDEPADAAAVVFLGDSHTWGYEVNFDQMFVNLLRDDLAPSVVYNLSHRGYGTDQSLLTFRRWQHRGPIRLVILTFYDNDIDENNSSVAYEKPKPKYEIVDDSLVLTNVPVPRLEQLYPQDTMELPPPTLRGRLRDLALRSHLIHDLAWRVPTALKSVKARLEAAARSGSDGGSRNLEGATRDFTLTARLLEELRDEVRSRGAALAVMALPLSKASVPTYQPELEAACDELGIDYLDLAPVLERRLPPRVHYRKGTHLTAYGHERVADAIGSYLAAEGGLRRE